MAISKHSGSCACTDCGTQRDAVHSNEQVCELRHIDHSDDDDCGSHGCACDSAHAHDHESCSCETGTETLDKAILGRIIVAAVLLVAGFLIDAGQWARLGIYGISYIIIGYDVIYRAARNLVKNRSLDENLLMSIASIGAFCIGEYAEGVLVMLLYQVGELFQSYAVGNSRKSIRSLVDMRPETVNILRGEEIVTIGADTAQIGDIMVVKAGERIALDGEIVEGESTLDTSALTGESLARGVGAGDTALSGCLNQTGLLKIKVTALLEQSSVSRIMKLVEEAAENKSQPEKFITRFARVYTPIVFIAAIIVAVIPPLFFAQDWYSWIYRALTFLVISCPCALVISVPLTYFAGIGGASKKGVLFKGSSSMDIMSRVKTVVFDKTGTLTTGEFQVTEIKPVAGVSEQSLLDLGAYVESFSDHPLARSIVSAYDQSIDKSRISEYSEQRGKGVGAIIGGEHIIAGNRVFIEENHIELGSGNAESTTVYVASDGKYLGQIMLGDTIKSDAPRAVGELKSAGVDRVVMLTGDNHEAAARTAGDLGIKEYYAGCLPEDKSRIMGEIMDGMEGSETLTYLGDGINDAPVLALADVGVAMGGVGSDAAIEAADVVIMNDEPSKILEALSSASRTKMIVMQNIVFALTVKALFLILGALGYSAITTAIFADVGVSLLAVLNAMRAAK